MDKNTVANLIGISSKFLDLIGQRFILMVTLNVALFPHKIFKEYPNRNNF